MAKRKQPAALARYQASQRSAPRAPRASAPIIIRQSAPATKHKKHRRHGGGGHSSMKMLTALVVGGFALGYIDKSNIAIPVPVAALGKAGTIAVATHFFGKGKPGMMTDIRNAAAVVAAYEFGFKGSVSGHEDGGSMGSTL